MMKKTILMTLLFVFAFLLKDATAQDFKSAIGARLGYPFSVTYKTFLNESSAIEIIGGTRGFGNGIGGYRWYQIAGAYQVHKPLDVGDIDGLQWYVGAGAAVYFWNYNNGFVGEGSNSSFGLQGYLGLSYTFEDSPINLTVDWVPTYFLNGFGGSGFAPDYGSFGIRYVLGGGD